jgi:hypothetical protein
MAVSASVEIRAERCVHHARLVTSRISMVQSESDWAENRRKTRNLLRIQIGLSCWGRGWKASPPYDYFGRAFKGEAFARRWQPC